MSTVFYGKVVPGGVMALGAGESSKLEDLHGREVKVTLTKSRNTKFHRLFFAMLKASLEMIDSNYNMEQWRAVVIAGAGHCDFVTLHDRLVAVPKSISFSNMDETEFGKVYNDAVGWICENYLTDPETIKAQAQFLSFL
jgi:hypothetical protein